MVELEIVKSQILTCIDVQSIYLFGGPTSLLDFLPIVSWDNWFWIGRATIVWGNGMDLIHASYISENCTCAMLLRNKHSEDLFGGEV